MDLETFVSVNVKQFVWVIVQISATFQKIGPQKHVCIILLNTYDLTRRHLQRAFTHLVREHRRSFSSQILKSIGSNC